ncbi:MAG: hypothetical protein LBB72_06435 [Spirochaetaceae bacterium]|jgi:hypothetical protein|nr:hypothetical protein [Spirochaetaceae bacterium]
MDNAEYQKALEQALNARADWLNQTEFPKFKDEFRSFHVAFASLYKLLIQKKLISEDPYKHEAKIGEIVIPKMIVPEGDKRDQLTLNLSAYDSQLDYLVNFFQFSIDFLNLENIKRILGLVKYIDWSKLVVDAPTTTTRVVAELINDARAGSDALALNVINELTGKLGKCTGLIMNYLKEATAFNRESYKLELRQSITGTMNDASVEQIKKKFPSAMPGRNFYPDLAEELIKEDFTPSGEELRSVVLKQLAIPENKPKVVKKEVSFKVTLMDGLFVISTVSGALAEIAPKMEENHTLFQNRKQTLMERIREILREMFNKEPEPVIYDIEYIDSIKGTAVKEKVNYNQFRTDLDKRTRSFASFSSRNVSRIEALDEKQLLTLLERAIRDAQSLHKTLGGLDEYFKAEAPKESREKVRGIKPELATIKNAFIKANQKRHEYSAQVEEEEQLKRLGVNPLT